MTIYHSDCRETEEIMNGVRIRVLVACEYSGTVRDAFIRAGHDAMSCDLLPTEKDGPHYRGDVRDVLADGDVPAPMCGRCDYCASMSRVQIADCATSDCPLIDDVFGINV